MLINLENIPNDPWVYFFKGKNWKVLYIWKAKNLKKRLSQYFATWSVWKQDMLSQADSVDFAIVKSESEALLLEINLINQHRPPFNNLLKWDTSYVYIKITNEDFPQIVFTRYRENDWAIYIWPKFYRQELKKLLQFLRQLIKFRGCKSTEFKKGKLTTDYFFWICEWWCIYNQLKIKNWELKINEAKTQWFKLNYSLEEAKKEYKKRLWLIVDFFKWDSKPIEKEILSQIENAIKIENYEYAAKLRDIFQNLKRFVEKQNVVLSEEISWHFYKIKKVWEYFVYVLMYFYEWKLIDIIRYKQLTNEIELNQLKKWFENEFWEFDIIHEDEIQTIWQSKSIKKIKKSTFDELDILMENFVESTIISSSFEKENLMNELLKNLQQKYWLNNFPYKIECIDISHLSGSRISWWLSCLNWWIPYKKWYRQYKIKSLIKKSSTYNDDYESIKELITRRFNLNKNMWLKNKENEDFPELFIIDWGKWQLWVLKEIINEFPKFKEIFNKIDFGSIWKWKARKTAWKIIWEKEKFFLLNKNLEIIETEFNYDDTDKLLIKIRDEAHRFSNKYRKKQMQKEFK